MYNFNFSIPGTIKNGTLYGGIIRKTTAKIDRIVIILAFARDKITKSFRVLRQGSLCILCTGQTVYYIITIAVLLVADRVG